MRLCGWDIPGALLNLDLGAIGKGYALEKAAGFFALGN